MKAFFLSLFKRRVVETPKRKLPDFMVRHFAAQDANIFGYHD